MSQSTFTPGPWEWEDGSLWGGRDRCVIGCITEAWAPDNDADAALLAAAPDLYKALSNAESFIAREDGETAALRPLVLAAIRFALAKATP